MGNANPTGYSAAVRIWLRRGDRLVRLSHTCGSFVVAKERVDLPPGDAEIVFTIDDEQFERPVTLPNGMSTATRETTVSERDSVAPF